MKMHDVTRGGHALFHASTCPKLVRLVLAVSVVAGCVSGCSARSSDVTQHNGSSTSDAPPARLHGVGADTHDDKTIGERFGIEILGVRLTAAGYLIDVRYRVNDCDKAMEWMDRRAKTYLVDESTGAKFYTPSPPKVGPLRQTSRQPRAGRTYFMMFANPGGFIKSGAKVSVVVGDLKLEHLLLQ